MNRNDQACANHAFEFPEKGILKPCVLSQGASPNERIAEQVADDGIDRASRGTAKLRPSEAALSVLAGERDAQRLIAAIGEGMAPANALRTGLEQILAIGDERRTAAAFRHLQKVLERMA